MEEEVTEDSRKGACGVGIEVLLTKQQKLKDRPKVKMSNEHVVAVVFFFCFVVIALIDCCLHGLNSASLDFHWFVMVVTVVIMLLLVIVDGHRQVVIRETIRTYKRVPCCVLRRIPQYLIHTQK